MILAPTTGNLNQRHAAFIGIPFSTELAPSSDFGPGFAFVPSGLIIQDCAGRLKNIAVAPRGP
jgi:hypothetical protein